MWISHVDTPVILHQLQSVCPSHSVYFIQLISSEYRGFEVATNPTALYLLSMDRRTGLLSILGISSQAVEIHPVFVGLILVSPSKTGKTLIGLCGNAKRYLTELGAGFAFGGKGDLRSGRSLPPKLPGVLQRDRRSRTSRCVSVLSRDVSGSVIRLQLRWLLTMKWFNSRGIQYRPCHSKQMACTQICKLNYFVLHTEFQSLEGEIMTCNMFLRRNTQW